MIPELDTVQKFLQPVRTPLLWRVIPWTFFSVGLAQLVSLYPLIQWHQRQLIEHRFEVVQARVDSVVVQPDQSPGALAQAIDAATVARIRGLTLHTNVGQPVVVRGDVPAPITPPEGKAYSYTKLDKKTMAVSWWTRGAQPLMATAVLDIEQETRQHEEFVLKAALLSVPSALIATLIGCFILLHGVILPVRRLRDELLAREAEHLPTTHDTPTSIDELDDVRSFVDQLAQARASALAMETLAVTDELTSVFTRRYFNESLELQLSLTEREGADLSVITIDVDFFKSINDTYGHAEGDEVLKRVAQICRDTLRAGDLLARFGGEEFVVLLPNTGVQGAGAVAEKVRHAIETGVRTPRPVTASLGTSTWAGCDDPTGEKMLRHADAAMYVAKRAGRNRVVQYELTTTKLAS